MLSEITLLACLLALITGEPTAPGIDRTLSPGVESMGFNVLYGDEDISVFNSVVNDVEKRAMKAKIRLNEVIQPLPAEDVKCLMSANHYCSSKMQETKSIIIQAIKDDCEHCSIAEKEEAGRVIAAMLAHDPVAWKLFLTRVALLIKERKRRAISQPDTEQYRQVGELEEVISARSNRYLMPGAKVRVKRSIMERVVD